MAIVLEKSAAPRLSRYQDSDGVILTIHVDGWRIFLQIPSRQEAESLARSENQFNPREFGAEFTFFKNASGEVERKVMVQFGKTLEAKKVSLWEGPWMISGIVLFLASAILAFVQRRITGYYILREAEIAEKR